MYQQKCPIYWNSKAVRAMVLLLMEGRMSEKKGCWGEDRSGREHWQRLHHVVNDKDNSCNGVWFCFMRFWEKPMWGRHWCGRMEGWMKHMGPQWYEGVGSEDVGGFWRLYWIGQKLTLVELGWRAAAAFCATCTWCPIILQKHMLAKFWKNPRNAKCCPHTALFTPISLTIATSVWHCDVWLLPILHYKLICGCSNKQPGNERGGRTVD